MIVSSQVLDGIIMLFLEFDIPLRRCQKIPLSASMLMIFIDSDFPPSFDSLILWLCSDASFKFMLDLTQIASMWVP